MKYILNIIMGVSLALMSFVAGFGLANWQWWTIVIGGSLVFGVMMELASQNSK